jgi:hypothetical protein
MVTVVWDTWLKPGTESEGLNLTRTRCSLAHAAARPSWRTLGHPIRYDGLILILSRWFWTGFCPAGGLSISTHLVDELMKRLMADC